jgi:type IV secretory pathway TrbD component
MLLLGLKAHATHVKHCRTDPASENVYARLYRPLGQLHAAT